VLSIEGAQVAVTQSHKLYFSRQNQALKLDLVRYYLASRQAHLRGIPTDHSS